MTFDTRKTVVAKFSHTTRKISQLRLFPFVLKCDQPSTYATMIILSHKLCTTNPCRPNPGGVSLGSKAFVTKTKQYTHPKKMVKNVLFLTCSRGFPGGQPSGKPFDANLAYLVRPYLGVVG